MISPIPPTKILIRSDHSSIKVFFCGFGRFKRFVAGERRMLNRTLLCPIFLSFLRVSSGVLFFFRSLFGLTPTLPSIAGETVAEIGVGAAALRLRSPHARMPILSKSFIVAPAPSWSLLFLGLLLWSTFASTLDVGIVRLWALPLFLSLSLSPLSLLSLPLQCLVSNEFNSTCLLHYFLGTCTKFVVTYVFCGTRSIY